MCSAMQQTSSNAGYCALYRHSPRRTNVCSPTAEHPEVKIGNDIGEHDMDEVDQEGQ